MKLYIKKCIKNWKKECEGCVAFKEDTVIEVFDYNISAVMATLNNFCYDGEITLEKDDGTIEVIKKNYSKELSKENNCVDIWS